MYKIVEKKLSAPLEESWIPIEYDAVPETTADDYAERIQRLWRACDCSCVIIYADREHFSNMHYFTGYDPRFEEALLILRRDQRPQIIVGNEGLDYVRIVPYDIEVRLYQTFSLMGQPNRQGSHALEELLRDCDPPQSGDIGLIGWKQYGIGQKSLRTDFPHYIVEALENIVDRGRLKNVTYLMSDCEKGLKHAITAKEIVQFEALGTKISRNVYAAIKDLRPGVREIDGSRGLCLDGDPMDVHPIFSFGESNVRLGLSSPRYHKRLALGDWVCIGYGLRGSLVNKSGLYVRNAQEIPEDKRDYMDGFVKPYFASIVRWYEMMQIGRACGDIWQMVEEWLGFERFNIRLNPGHLSHTDEWTDSPFYPESKIHIRSGMALQCDYTVSFSDPYMTSHVEDGLVIADKELREQVAVLGPQCWGRIQQRRDLMKRVLNIALPDEVLPLSDLPAICFPYMGDTSTILAKA